MRTLGPVRHCGVVGRGVTTFLVRGHGIAGEQIVALAATDRVAARGHLEVNEANRHTRSEEHTSELQSLMRLSYAVFCLKKKKNIHKYHIKVTKHHNNKKSIKVT